MVWPWLVRMIGWNVRGLGMLSAVAGLAGAGLVYLTGKVVFAHYVARMKTAKGVEGELWYVLIPTYSSMIAAWAYLGAVLDGGFSPLTTWALAPLLGVYCAAVAWTGGLRRRVGTCLAAAALIGYGTVEGVVARRCLAPLALPAAGWFVLLGVLPLAAMVNLTYWRKFVIHRVHRRTILAVWAAVVVAFAGARLKSERGRAAERTVAAIIENAAGKIAVASDGGLDDLFAFMLPKGMRLITLARDRDPAYGRELAAWVRGFGTQLPSANANLAKTDVATTARNTAPTPQSVFAKVDAPTNDATLAFSDSGVATEGSVVAGSENAKIAYRASDLRSNIEDLAFAAELGPVALVDEWLKIDRPGFEAKVATAATYFPTRAKWKEAYAIVGNGDGGGAERYLRRLMGVTGNALGCRALEEGKKDEAWSIFWEIMERVDKENYAAVLNLIGMANRGYDAGKRAVEFVQRRRTEIESGLKTPERMVAAARAGGRLYADPEDVAKYEKAQKEIAAKRELSPDAKALVEAVAAAPKDAERGRAAQEAIHKAIREGKVRTDRIGGRLIAIDLALGDRENAEKDAIDVLKLDRHEPTANAALGSLAMERGDYARAERYLRRALATGKASAGAKNDLAWTLYRLGKLDEAEPFAREAVGALGGSWALRETLAAILIRAGKTEEGERELAKAEELAEKAGIPKGRIVSIEIDRARILKSKEDYEHLKMVMRQLKARKDLTDEQREEVRGMDW